MIRKIISENKIKIIISVPLSILILWGVKLDLLPEYTGGDKIGNTFSSMHPDQIKDVLLLLAIIIITAIFLINIKNIRNSYYTPAIIIGLFFAVMMSVGKAYRHNNSLSILFSGSVQALKTAVRTLAFFILFSIMIFLIFMFLERYSTSLFEKGSSQGFAGFVKVHSLRLYLIMLAFTILIYLIFMPGFLMGDTASQIYESFGVEAYYFPSDFPFKYNDSVLTNMHPIVSTFYVYFCMLIGKLVSGSYNTGIYIAVIIQFAISELVIVRSCKNLAELGLKSRYILAYIIYIYINVVMVNYFFVLTKDILYTAFLFLFVIELFILITDRMQKKDYLLLAFSALGTVAFRGEGLYCILITLAITVIYLIIKKHKIRSMIYCGSVFAGVLVVHLIWTFAVLPALHVSPGVKSLQMAVPMQQVGRYVSSGKELTDEEFDAINNVLDVEQIKTAYDPSDGDSLKKYFKHNCTEEEMNSFTKAWRSILIKDPVCAFSSWLNNKYEFFYLENTYMHPYSLSWSQTMMDDVNRRTLAKVGVDLGISYPMSETLTNIRFKVENAAYLFKDLPVINVLMLPGFYILLLLIASVFMFVRKSGTGKVLLIVPWFTVLVTNLLSAVNASYGRYLYPVMLMLPFIFFAGISEKSHN